MNAFSALLHWDGRPAERSVLAAANASVRYRCPHGSWLWSAGAIGLAQADLASLPEDRPGEAVTLGQLRIASSCRIDNRDQLRHKLPATLLPPDAPDALFILAAYRVWGEDCVDHLIGDFAFAIWDGEKHTLFAARDISGSRQLFYYRDRETLFLASTRTQILQDPSIPLEVDEAQMIEYLAPIYQFTSGWDQGLLRGFRVLEPGQTLRAQDGHITIRKFWNWQEQGGDTRSEKQVLEEYLHTLEEAVRCRLRSRVNPVAIELSGGLDSSAVACLAARLNTGHELHTLSSVFDQIVEVDERERIQAVLDRYELIPHMVASDDIYGPQCFDPNWSPQSVLGPDDLMMVPAVDRLYDAALESGCRVVLTGQMGDALNDGNQRVYFDMLRRRRLLPMLRWMKITSRRSWKQALARPLFDD